MHAIVLAGGKGERLRPFTEDRPKPMVEIMGIPILSYQLQWLQGQGVRDVVISCGYRHDVIESYFGTGERLGLRIVYSVEDEPLGRGGALRLALSRVPETRGRSSPPTATSSRTCASRRCSRRTTRRACWRRSC